MHNRNFHPFVILVCCLIAQQNADSPEEAVQRKATHPDVIQEAQLLAALFVHVHNQKPASQFSDEVDGLILYSLCLRFRIRGLAELNKVQRLEALQENDDFLTAMAEAQRATALIEPMTPGHEAKVSLVLAALGTGQHGPTLVRNIADTPVGECGLFVGRCQTAGNARPYMSYGSKRASVCNKVQLFTSSSIASNCCCLTCSDRRQSTCQQCWTMGCASLRYCARALSYFALFSVTVPYMFLAEFCGCDKRNSSKPGSDCCDLCGMNLCSLSCFHSSWGVEEHGAEQKSNDFFLVDGRARVLVPGSLPGALKIVSSVPGLAQLAALRAVDNGQQVPSGLSCLRIIYLFVFHRAIFC
jgi:hypothetical protein